MEMLPVNPINSFSRNECKQTNKEITIGNDVAEMKMSQEMASEKESITGSIHIKSFLSTLNT